MLDAVEERVGLGAWAGEKASVTSLLELDWALAAVGWKMGPVQGTCTLAKSEVPGGGACVSVRGSERWRGGCGYQYFGAWLQMPEILTAGHNTMALGAGNRDAARHGQ